MNVYDATEIAYKNGYEAGRGSMANQCVMCGAEMPEGGHVCTNCMDGAAQPIHLAQVSMPPKPNTELSFGANDGQYDFLVYYRRAEPLTKFQIWMYKVCFGIRARNI